MHDLIQVLHNHTHFELNQFEVQLFRTAVTLKSCQGHGIGHEHVKLNKYCYHAKFASNDIHSVQENPNVKVCATVSQLAVQTA